MIWRGCDSGGGSGPGRANNDDYRGSETVVAGAVPWRMPGVPDIPERLPSLDRAEISPAKLRDYLLNPEHPVGRDKARFLAGLGFQRVRWVELQWALLSHAAAGVAQVLPLGRFGQKYLVRGNIRGPNGGAAFLVAVWIISDPAAGPRFVTAYPEEPR